MSVTMRKEWCGWVAGWAGGGHRASEVRRRGLGAGSLDAARVDVDTEENLKCDLDGEEADVGCVRGATRKGRRGKRASCASELGTPDHPIS